MSKRSTSKKWKGNPSAGVFLPALCVPIANVSTSTISAGESNGNGAFEKDCVETGGQEKCKNENKDGGYKTSDDVSTAMLSMRVTMRGLRQIVGKRQTVRAGRERTTASQRMDVLKRLLDPFFGKHDGTNGTLTPRCSFSARGGRMRVSPWDRVDSPLCKKVGTNSEGCTPSHSTRSNNGGGVSNSDISEFTDSLKAYTLYSMLRALRRSGGRNEELNEGFSFFEDDFVDFECATGKGNKRGFNKKGMKRMWDRLRRKA